MGARNILMTDFPLAGEPLTVEANAYLNTELKTLEFDSDTDFMFYSLTDFNQKVLTDPTSFDLPPLRTDISCIEAGAQATGCVGFYSFDGVHPTAAIQAAGYRDMNQRFQLTSIQAIPEPANWAMMCIGFAALGATLRWRRRKNVTSQFGSGVFVAKRQIR